MLTDHYNTLSKPISPKSICCISQTSVSLYRSAGERSHLSLAEARIKRSFLLLIWRKGTKKRIGGTMSPEERSVRRGGRSRIVTWKISNPHVENKKSPRGREKNLRTYHLILPKYHLILPKNFSSPPEEIEISSGTIWEIPRRKSESIGATGNVRLTCQWTARCWIESCGGRGGRDETFF